jgi:hypothetical protein
VSADAANPPTGPEVVLRSVTVGRYTLELGDRDGAKLEALDGGKPPVPLAQAIAQVEAGQGTPATGVEVLEHGVSVAEQVTNAIELARNLFVQIAQGRPPDVATIDGAVEMLLGLLQRLDVDEHWEKAVRVARELAKLLALLERWMELLQSLQTALRGAKKAKDLGGRAWALHEQGTLQLAAGNHAKADCLLGKAHDLREEIHDRSGLRMTDHNLQVLCKTLRVELQGSTQMGPKPRVWFPLRPVQALVFAMLLLAVGGVAGAVIRGRGGPVRTVSVSGAGGGENGEHGGGQSNGPTGGGTTAGSGTAKKVEVTAAPESVPAGTATSEITAKVLNADREPLSRQLVKFAVKPEDGAFSSSSASTNAEGDAQTKLTFIGARTAAVEDTVEACAATHVCGTVRVRWETRSTQKPSVLTEGHGEPTSSSVGVAGSVSPSGSGVEKCEFLYMVAKEANFTVPSTASVECGDFTPGAGTSAVAVTAQLSNLAPGQTYDYQLLATVEGTSHDGGVRSFETPQASSPSP